ncbi:MAG: hypothetical protein E4H37_06350 [Gemmatimonadales bacterium]|nr:MAG: hypothetical protein E4H37_06350 [Gemmatimonadales bacterium]
MSRDTVARNGLEILEALDRGLTLPEQDIPRIERRERPAPDPALEARLDRLKAARNRLARQIELPPGVICPNGTLEAIARTNPKTIAGLKRVAGVREWQTRVFGEELLRQLEPGDA